MFAFTGRWTIPVYPRTVSKHFLGLVSGSFSLGPELVSGTAGGLLPPPVRSNPAP